MRTVKEVSRLTGVSVRTLHHYDAIGLLRPTRVTQAGYRLYDDAALHRLQEILLFRELRFPLEEIRKILDRPGHDPVQALEEQIRLLELERRRLDTLIDFARNMQKQGGNLMEFKAFDRTELEQYREEARRRWDNTDAWRECEQKTAGKTEEQMQNEGSQLMAIFARLGALRTLPARDAAVQAQVGALQTFISEHYYQCTDQILEGLGEMYGTDERMKHNIDAAGGEGTADFAREAIRIYCAK